MTPAQPPGATKSRASRAIDVRSAKLKHLRRKLDELIEIMIAGEIRYPEAKHEFEKRFVAIVMEQERGNLSRAAKALHIHRNTLSKKLSDLDLDHLR
jgi:DNA-binding NtrC family response regulator